jgi:hypothetical protein
MNMTASATYSANRSETQSRQDTARHAQEITKKASSRAKEEHKISFKVATTYEHEEQSYREIRNPSDEAIRYDFHRLMKKWRIDLYRYDVRLTYDIVIPEPGSYLLRKYVLLERIQNELAKPNPFTLASSSISRNPRSSPSGWGILAETYGVSLDPPPDEFIHLPVKHTVAFSRATGGPGFLELLLPEGYNFNSCVPAATTGVGDSEEYWLGINGKVYPSLTLNTSRLLAGALHSNRFEWYYGTKWANAKEGDAVNIAIDLKGRLTPKAFAEWQMSCYERLADAAKAQHEANQQRLLQMHDTIWEELNREDALTLRKLEREELMKGVLRWLVGPSFSFYPQSELGLPDLSTPFDQVGSLAGMSSLMDTAFPYYDPTTGSVRDEFRSAALLHGELIKFFQQAIEWENMTYVLYPYFWTDPDTPHRWDFKQSLFHPEFTHRNFLRAGAARVVLTIRPGFEKSFLSRMEGVFDDLLPEGHVYLPLSDELEAMAKTSYPYTPDANLDKEEYLFTWGNVQSDSGSENGRLQRSLRQNFYVAWAEEGGVQITADDQRIEVAIDQELPRQENVQEQLRTRISGSVVITLKKETAGKGVATLAITGGKEYTLSAREEEGKWKIYRLQNLVDTWYEYTPTGALDVVVGQTLGGNS